MRWIAGAMLGLLAGAAAGRTVPVPPAAEVPLPSDQAALKAHVLFLAADSLKGREASSPEYRIAADYVAAQFYAAGLKPAGEQGGYLQTVPLVTYRPAGQGDLVLTRRGAAPMRLVFGEDYVPGANPAAATTTIDAPVTFVGFGIVAPDARRDDYAGVDVRGRIVAFFPGAPSRFQSEERAHFASLDTKLAIAAARGAVGAVVLQPRDFRTGMATWDQPRTTWAKPAGTGGAMVGFGPPIPALAALSDAGAAKLFAGARQPWSEIVKASGIDSALFHAMPLAGNLAIAVRTAFASSVSYNVAGLIPGSDPKLGREMVVLSAHLDHLGVGAPDATGDTIYNGAEDNAVGVAALIEEAKRFAASGKPPRRSVLFLATTAEEKGLVGADYFARHPTVPDDTIVADVNLDMPILTYRFEDVTVFGADRSSLGPIVAKAAGAMGVAMSPDPDPAQGLFVRSDHYRFVQQGVPSVFLWPGQAGAGKAAWADFFARHYHQPSDEVTLPIDWGQGVRFVALNYAIAREIADGEARPAWNKSDFFGLLYKGYGAK